MWVNSWVGCTLAFVWEDVCDVCDRSVSEHDETESFVGGVEARGKIDDQTDAAVQLFVMSVVDAEANRGKHSR